jgi:hypothetical protein
MPRNDITPQNPDADDDLDDFEEFEEQQGTKPTLDDEFDDDVDVLNDEWP